MNSFGEWLLSNSRRGVIAIGFDLPTRSSLVQKIISSLLREGWPVVNLGHVIEPALALYSSTHPTVAGAIYVSSTLHYFSSGHLVDYQGPPALPFSSNHRSADCQDDPTAQSDYLANLQKLSLTLHLSTPKIILDLHDSPLYSQLPTIFSQSGVGVSVHHESDFHHPHPSTTGHLSHLVTSQHAALSAAISPDGTQLFVVDDTGRLLTPDSLIALIATFHKLNLTVPHSFSQLFSHLPVKIHRSPNQLSATTTGEFILSPATSPDAFVALFWLLETLSLSSKPLSVLVDELPHFYISRHMVHCPAHLQARLLTVLSQHYTHTSSPDPQTLIVDKGHEDKLIFTCLQKKHQIEITSDSPLSHRSRILLHDAENLIHDFLVSTYPPSTSSLSLDLSLDSLHVGESLRLFPKQCGQVVKDIATQDIPAACHLVDNVVISGMGGSALGGRIVSSLFRDKLRLPLIVSTEYTLPNFVNEKSLVVVSSYSGNTKETLTALSESRARGAQVFIIASGGKLAQIAKKDKLPAYIFDTSFNVAGQPRLGLGYNVLALIGLFTRCGIVPPVPNLSQTEKFLQSRQSDTLPLQDLSRQLTSKIPILVASEHLVGAAHAVKNQFNENAKNFCNMFDIPELNHHLLEGLSFPKTNPDNLHFVFFTSPNYAPAIKAAYPATSEILKRQHIPFSFYELHGGTKYLEVMDLLQSGALISYYLALYNGIDPGPIPWVDWYKEQLKAVK